MKTKTKLLISLFILEIAPSVLAQNARFEFSGYNDLISKADTLTEKSILYQYRKYEFKDEDDFVEYQTQRDILYVNSDEQVEANKTRYFYFTEKSDLVNANISVLTPDNKKINLTKEDLLTTVDESTNENYRYFALDGLTKGSIIDCEYTRKKQPYLSGSRVFFQDEYPIDSFVFELIAPMRLNFAFKIYNDSLEVVPDTINEEQKCWSFHQKNIEALKEEERSVYTTLLKQVVYKLDYNSALNKKDISSFGTASKNIYTNFFVSEDKKDKKGLEKLLREIPEQNNNDLLTKVNAIENYLKSNFNFVETEHPDFQNIAPVIKNRSASGTGMVKLFIQVLKQSGIDAQLVATCDHDKIFFDKDFESFNCLTNYLIFIPALNHYICPDQFEYRNGVLPYSYTRGNGLFIKEKQLGDFKTGIGKVGYIEPLPYENNYHNINAIVTFNDDFNSTNVDLKLMSGGYYALGIQPYYDLISQEKKVDYLKGNLNQAFDFTEYLTCTVQNEGVVNIGIKPFIQEYTLTTNSLIEKAGNKYLFKIGELIGRQMEMYGEENRKLPVNDLYKRMFKRKLTVTIPDGYQIVNPEKLNISLQNTKKDKVINQFVSVYSLKNNELKVDILEFYDYIFYSANEFNAYKDIVNAAADYEKLVLLIEKKN